MLKRILVLLGETPSALTARKYAFLLGAGAGAEVAGLAGLDPEAILAPLPGAIGSSAYKAAVVAERRQEASEANDRLRRAFANECVAHNMPVDLLISEGDVARILLQAAARRDLIVTGFDTGFHGDLAGRQSEMLAALLARTPRPLIVCPEQIPTGKGVLVAYDASLPAMRSLQLFALLGFARDQPICITSVEANPAGARQSADSASDYLRCHGYTVESSAINSKADPSEVLRIEVADRKVGMLVMGAYGRHGLRSYFFGSTTNTLITAPPTALFVYH